MTTTNKQHTQSAASMPSPEATPLEEWGPFWAWFFQAWPRRLSALVSGEPVGAVLSGLGLVGSERVLDVGSGSGFYSFRLAELLPEGQVIAIDGCAKMIERLQHAARRRGLRERIRAEVGDAQSLSMQDDSVDAAIAIASLHHVADPVVGIRELGRVIRPGGTVAIVEGLVDDSKPRDKQHGLDMTEGELRGELAAAGFEDIVVDTHRSWSFCLAKAGSST